MTAWLLFIWLGLTWAQDQPVGEPVLEPPSARGFTAASDDPLREPPEAWAVVVGISDYEHLESGKKRQPGQLADLRFADDDALAVAEVLQSPNFGAGGIPADHMLVLTNEQADYMAVRSALLNFLGKAGKDDLVIVFFAGHGLPHPAHPSELYLMTHDTVPHGDMLAGTGLPMSEVQSALARVRADRVVFFADACHSGGIEDSELAARGAGNRVSYFLGELAKVRKSRAVISSSQADELSYEDTRWKLPGLPGEGHGAFTWALLRSLTGQEGAVPADGLIRLGHVVERVQRLVSSATDDRQTPKMTGTLDGRLPLYQVALRRDDKEQEIGLQLADARRAATARWTELTERFDMLSPQKQFDELITYIDDYQDHHVAVGGTSYAVQVPEVGFARQRLGSLAAEIEELGGTLEPARLVVRAKRPYGKPGPLRVTTGGRELTRTWLAAPFEMTAQPGEQTYTALMPHTTRFAGTEPMPFTVMLSPGRTTVVELDVGLRRPKLSKAQVGLMVPGVAAMAAGAALIPYAIWGATFQDLDTLGSDTAERNAILVSGIVSASVGVALTTTALVLPPPRRATHAARIRVEEE